MGSGGLLVYKDYYYCYLYLNSINFDFYFCIHSLNFLINTHDIGQYLIIVIQNIGNDFIGYNY